MEELLDFILQAVLLQVNVRISSAHYVQKILHFILNNAYAADAEFCLEAVHVVVDGSVVLDVGGRSLQNSEVRLVALLLHAHDLLAVRKVVEFVADD